MVRVFKFLNSKGTSLVETLVALAITSISLLVIGSVAQQAAEVRRYQNAHSNFNRISQTVRDRMKFSRICTETFAGVNINMAQLNANIVGTNEVTLTIPLIRQGSAGNVNLIGSAGAVNVITPPNIRIDSLRVTQLRQVLNTIDPITGASDYTGILRFSGRRDTGNLIGGSQFREVVIGTVMLNLAPGGAVNHCTGQQANSIADICEQLGCTYVETDTPPCNCPRDPFGCPPGQLLTGVDANNQMVCENWGGDCPAGQILVRARPGTLTCEEPPRCTAGVGAISWYGVDDISYCYNSTAIDMPSGESLAIDDTVAPTTGSATVSCTSGFISAPTGATCVGGGLPPPPGCVWNEVSTCYSADGTGCTPPPSTCPGNAAPTVATTSGDICYTLNSPLFSYRAYACGSGTWNFSPPPPCTPDGGGPVEVIFACPGGGPDTYTVPSIDCCSGQATFTGCGAFAEVAESKWATCTAPPPSPFVCPDPNARLNTTACSGSGLTSPDASLMCGMNCAALQGSLSCPANYFGVIDGPCGPVGGLNQSSTVSCRCF